MKQTVCVPVKFGRNWPSLFYFARKPEHILDLKFTPTHVYLMSVSVAQRQTCQQYLVHCVATGPPHTEVDQTTVIRADPLTVSICFNPIVHQSSWRRRLIYWLWFCSTIKLRPGKKKKKQAIKLYFPFRHQVKYRIVSLKLHTKKSYTHTNRFNF